MNFLTDCHRQDTCDSVVCAYASNLKTCLWSMSCIHQVYELLAYLFLACGVAACHFLPAWLGQSAMQGAFDGCLKVLGRYWIGSWKVVQRFGRSQTTWLTIEAHPSGWYRISREVVSRSTTKRNTRHVSVPVIAVHPAMGVRPINVAAQAPDWMVQPPCWKCEDSWTWIMSRQLTRNGHCDVMTC
jgi:hypothetical protein